MQFYVQKICKKNRAHSCVYKKKAVLLQQIWHNMKKRRQEKHTCAYCGKTFSARAGALYCSASCRNTAAKLKRELMAKAEAAKNTPVQAQIKPVERKTAPVGTITQPIQQLTPEQAKAELWSMLATAGIIWAIDALFSPKKSRRRK